MSLIKSFLVVMLLAFSIATQAADLGATYMPTRAEWLKLSIATGLCEQLNLSSKRVTTIVLVDPKTNEVTIVVTLANGETEPTQELKKRYVQQVKSIARAVADRYTWAKDIRIEVQFA